MTKYNPTQNIRRSLKLSVLALVAGSALWLSGCKSDRIYTVTQYSVSGEKIGEWKNARIVKGRSGWCIIETSDGKQVMIDGPHRWQEQ